MHSNHSVSAVMFKNLSTEITSQILMYDFLPFSDVIFCTLGTDVLSSSSEADP